ncbi:Bax inhibitor-1/YccA family protein [Corallococcus sp. M34]|uniref:Bax inhibitor-1/YccA family protein n=1 Tax=Citreicoccus inhibens TaxID=2849499 RepID=UPI001C22B717|nr:Bax inhibitor-1/YccA family protein [Citreicoccus inhibens]MBU8896890.1 Bax inhibitor-1/YccA family protein [Citreicoccus inhibens]
MAWETSGWQTAESPTANELLMQQSQRTFMTRVYAWMFVGLMITGATAFATVANQAWLSTVLQWRFGLIIAQLGLVLALSGLAPRLSGPVAGALFVLYSALTGTTLSVIFLVYTMGSIGQAFFLAGGVFAAMALYGTFTKKDLDAWKSFLFIGLVGIVLAGVVNLFLSSDGLGFVTACATVLVFAGLTAYDNQKLRQYHASSGFSSAATLSIVGALILYLDFVNLFLAMVRLFGKRR